MLTRLSTFFAPLLLCLMLAQPAHASGKTKYYQYNGQLPFVEMMLNMMVAMGILDKIPAQYMNNGYGNNGYGRYGYMNQLMLRNALLKRGVSPMALSSMGMMPMGMNSMGMNPMTMSGLGFNPMSLDAMKLNRLGRNRYGFNNMGLNQLGMNRLGLNDLSLAQESPWAQSPWDNALTSSFPSSSFTDEPFVDDDSFAYTYSNEPFSRPYNNRDNYRGSAGHYSPLAKYETSAASRNRRVNTPLARLSDSYPAHRSDAYANDSYRKQSPYADNSPCVTELCGLEKYTQAPPYSHLPVLTDSPLLLDGLWVTDSGEMLGIKAQRFLWSDGNSRYLTGQIQASQDHLLARVDGKEMTMSFQYRVEQNRLMTQDQNGLIRVFNRIPIGRI